MVDHAPHAAYMLACVSFPPLLNLRALAASVQAQAMGHPIGATDHGGAQEAINGETGWLITDDADDGRRRLMRP